MINYMVLVNPKNPLPDKWTDGLETTTAVNSVGDETEAETKAYRAYLLLKADLAENNGIFIELDSALRSVAAQQNIMKQFAEEYGEEYAAKTVAVPGYSEHHTGLALDLYFRLKNEHGEWTDICRNEDMVQYPALWTQIHSKLADYGFILRYPEGKEHITGYGYEPWHIRYIDSINTAKEIMKHGLTLEEYLDSAGMRIAARAEYLYNVLWECQRDVEGWEYTFLKGNRYHIPYGQPINDGAYIGFQADIETFIRAAGDPESVFYSRQSYWDDTEIRSTFYAMDCSAFAAYCWGVPRTTTAGWHKLDCTCLGSVSQPGILDTLQPGDAINRPADHIVLVTAVNDDGTIVIIHETVPQIMKETLSKEEIIQRYSEYVIYRYNERDNAAPSAEEKQ